jgi:FkbM family methyltransferase
MDLKSRIKQALLKRGYRISRSSVACTLGYDPFLDMVELTQAGARPTLFDVGANAGQTVEQFRRHFARPIIHAFEPGESTFQQLKANTAAIPDLRLNNLALGSRSERRVFVENDHPDMSSFLEPGKEAWGAITGRREIEIDTVDRYCERESIAHIDVLKADTQGFDYEVVKGAAGMLQEHRIHLIYMEVIFFELYKGLPPFDEVYRFLTGHGMSLLSFYTMHIKDGRAAWTDAIFVDPEFRRPA